MGGKLDSITTATDFIVWLLCSLASNWWDKCVCLNCFIVLMAWHLFGEIYINDHDESTVEIKLFSFINFNMKGLQSWTRENILTLYTIHVYIQFISIVSADVDYMYNYLIHFLPLICMYSSIFVWMYTQNGCLCFTQFDGTSWVNPCTGAVIVQNN